MAAAHVAVGWRLEFQSLPPYLWSWLLIALTGVPASRIARRYFPWSGAADRLLRATVIAFAIIVAVGLVLGGLGLTALIPYICLHALVCAASLALRVPPDGDTRPSPAVPAPIAAVVIPLLAFIVAAGLLQSPPTLYDALSYHLVFAARWLLDHRLSIVATPFSDPAQAYQPANGELFFLWLMLPFHGDLLARIGQLPFLALAAIGLYALARRSGARPEHAMYASFFFLLVRPVVEQAAGADVDLVCAATFVTSLYLGILAVDRDRPGDWAMWGVSVGLFLGSKYLALVYAPVLLVLPFVRGARPKALWAVPGVAALALPWYVRNWVVAGSPIYPASLQAFGVVIGAGAFTRAAMNNSVFHVTEWRLLPAIVAHAFGAPTLLVWLPAAAAGITALVSRRRWWPGVYLTAAPLLMLVLLWIAVPDNGDSRFLLAAVSVAMVPLAWGFGRHRTWNGCLHGAYLAAAVWILIGVRRDLPLPLAWFMGHWLALDGLVVRAAGWWFAGAASIVVLAVLASRRSPYRAAIMTAVCSAACVVAVAVNAADSSPPGESRLLDLSPTYIRPEMFDAWDWLHASVARGTIANTGNNLPYPLFGPHLTNRVYDVNIDRHGEWRFHDYARMRRRSIAVPAGALAHPSGQMLPLAGPVADAARPRYERWEGSPETWRRNLRDAGVTYLFVSALSAYERPYVEHNAGGFPVEDNWARADPGAFVLIYQNQAVRIYRVGF